MTLMATTAAVGDTFVATVVEGLHRAQIVQYAGASGDFNPLHTDEIFATCVANYPSVFAHGMLTMGMTAHMLTDWVGDGRLTRFGGRFLAQVWPGDTLTATATVRAIDATTTGTPVAELDVVTENQHRVPVFQGYATATIQPN